MHILLVEPDYYTRYPPLGLLKLASMHTLKKDSVELVRGIQKPFQVPDRIFVTSLFTYSWRPVHKCVQHYKKLFPGVPVLLGGIYATLMPEHAKTSGADEVIEGVVAEAEQLMPEWSLVPNWDASILFSSRGCVRHCEFCSVPRTEPIFRARASIKQFVYPGHKRIILWDNNFLASRYSKSILDELHDLGLRVDFNQGLDARFIKPDRAAELVRLKFDFLRLAYDAEADREQVVSGLRMLLNAGVRGRKLVVYVLYNFTDSPEQFLKRVQDLMELGCVAYPMRFEPLDSLDKNKYVAPQWTNQQLEMIADARRVIGCAGAWPPYEGLRRKFLDAPSFEEALALRPVQYKQPRVTRT